MTPSLARLHRRIEAVAHRALLHTSRPDHLPASSPAEWSHDDLAALGAFVAQAQRAGAQRPLGWMPLDDLLTLRGRLHATPETENAR